jgi:hypothetical protein
MGVIAAYDMYNECCDDFLDASWAIPKKKQMGFTEFQIKLSEQMLKILKAITMLEMINFDASLNNTNFAGHLDQQIAWIHKRMKYCSMMA